MNLTINIFDDVVLVKISGTVDSQASGRLYDTLVGILTGGNKKLVIDLADVPDITRAGLRSLIVSARLMQTRRGVTRICGASREIVDSLESFGFSRKVLEDLTLEDSLRAVGVDPGSAHGAPEAAVAA